MFLMSNTFSFFVPNNVDVSLIKILGYWWSMIGNMAWYMTLVWILTFVHICYCNFSFSVIFGLLFSSCMFCFLQLKSKDLFGLRRCFRLSQVTWRVSWTNTLSYNYSICFFLSFWSNYSFYYGSFPYQCGACSFIECETWFFFFTYFIFSVIVLDLDIPLQWIKMSW